MSPGVRILLGLLLGVLLVVLGIPVLQAVVHHTGYFSALSFEQACLALVVILLTMIAALLAGKRDGEQ